MDDFIFDPVPHEEAIDFIKSKSVVRRDVFQNLLPELKARCISVTGVESFDALQAIRDKVAELPAGGDWNAIKKDLVNDLHPYLIDSSADAETREKQEIAANRRAELLIRTHGFQAYQSASYQVMDRQRDVFTHWQYKSMGDGHVRHTHAALDGIVLPENADFWKGHFPPWEWGCRCQVIPLLPEDVEDIKEGEKGKPYEKQSVLEGPALAELESNRRLVRGPNEVFDLRNARERGNGNGFYWDPGDLHLTREQLQSRYDSETWAHFNTWAEKTNIGKAGLTVADWIGGATAPAPVVMSQILSVAELAPQLDVLIQIPDPVERREKFLQALELPPEERGTLAHTARTDRANIDAGFAFLNRFTRSSLTPGDKVKIKRTADRAHAGADGSYINGRRMSASVVAHEAGHVLESRSPALRAKSVAFRDGRTIGEEPRWLGPGYRASEVTLDDEWVARGGRVYTGKVYKNSRGGDYATEIVSMGIERLMRDPADFYRQDLDYFTYLVNALRDL